MFKEILPFYNQELNYIRERALEFAKAYPKIAKNLFIGAGKIEDPDTSRLVEAFAFLNAHVLHKLEDDFSEMAESLLSVLFPHYLSSVPAFSVVRFEFQPELDYGYTIPKGSLIDTGSFYEESCTFKTIYPVTVWPIEVREARIDALPFKAPLFPQMKEAKAVLSLKLNYADPKIKFSDTAPEALSFFLNGLSSHTTEIYKLLFNHTIAIALRGAGNTEAKFLNPTCLQPLGFNPEDNLLPFSTHASQGYDLLAEYFIFPEKFLFFKLSTLNLENLQTVGNILEIFIYLNVSHSELEKNLNASHFKLGCTPIVNLFPQIAEPFLLDHKTFEYPIIPDARRKKASLSVYAVQTVSVLSDAGETLNCRPFYSLKHAETTDETSFFWYAKRQLEHELYADFTLSFTHLNLNALEKTMEGMVQVEALCSNGTLPNKLPFNYSEPYLQLSIKGAPILAVQCLLPFTPSFQPHLRDGIRWKLLSHLTLNYLAFSNYENGIGILKEMLSLYNFNEAPENKKMIDSLLNLRCKRVTARISNQCREAFSQGIEVLIEVDDADVVGEQFLFLGILNRFFGRYATVNSFTQLVVSSTKKGVLYRWAPRIGNKTLF